MEFQEDVKKILAIGDFHIPERADRIPDWIIDILSKETKNRKFDFVLCTGDLTEEKILKELSNFGTVKCVKGNMDYLNLPERELINLGRVKILLLHGSEIHPRGDIRQLDEIRKVEDADIVVHGHTHKMSFEKIETKDGIAVFINPGTATGVWGGSSDETSQTFLIIEIKHNDVRFIFFEDGKIKKEEVLCIQKKR